MVETIYLIRHCEAEGNIYRRVHGDYDGRPMPNGVLQCNALAERFADIELSAVYASDLQRARFTASHLSDDILVDKRFREINLGVWEDKTWGEVARDYPREWALFTAPSLDFAIEKGETFFDVGNRMQDGLNNVIRKHDEAIAIISHGIAIRRTAGLIQGEYGELKHCDNTGVSKIDVSPNGEMTLDFYGDNSHLGELSTIEKQQWWRAGGNRSADALLCFDPINLPHENELAEALRREAWQAIYGSLSDYHAELAMAEMTRCIRQHSNSVALVRNQDDEVVGIIVLDTAHKAEQGRGHISALAVTEKHRGTGLGVQFVGHAVSFYRKLGRKVLHLRVAECNKKAIAMYKKVGFAQVSVEDTELKRQVFMEMVI